MTWRMLRMQVLVEQRVFWRNLSTTFFTFALPLALLLVVVLDGGDRDMLPAIVALGIVSTSFQGLAMQLAMHRDQGVLKGLLATPMPPLVLVAAKVLSALVVVAIEAVVVVVVGTAFTDASLPQQPLAFALFAVLGTAAFAAIAFAVASVVPTSDAAPAIVNAVYLALIALWVLVGRVDDLPDAVLAIGRALPIDALFDALRDAWLGGGDGLAVPLLALVGWTLAATWWTLRRFRWEPREALR